MSHPLQRPALEFTSDWVSRHLRNWRKHLQLFAGKPGLRFLEIGSWEGRSTCWFLQEILTHPSSRITCIDTFAGSPLELKSNPYLRRAVTHIERRFDRNIALLRAAKKVIKKKGPSQVILRAMPLKEMFDVVYIDGSHLAADVMADAILTWPLLKRHGILIFDDYRWNCILDKKNALVTPAPAIDAFLLLFRRQLSVLGKGRQVFVRKR